MYKVGIKDINGKWYYSKSHSLDDVHVLISSAIENDDVKKITIDKLESED